MTCTIQYGNSSECWCAQTIKNGQKSLKNFHLLCSLLDLKTDPVLNILLFLYAHYCNITFLGGFCPQLQPGKKGGNNSGDTTGLAHEQLNAQCAWQCNRPWCSGFRNVRILSKLTASESFHCNLGNWVHTARHHWDTASIKFSLFIMLNGLLRLHQTIISII